ncbi:MAG: efflux RND transporter periplasmic adaptor subunit [Chloroflexales bacterium]
MRRILIPIVIILAVVGAVGWIFYQRQTSAASAQNTFSGTIEADEVDITSEISGRVEQVLVGDGSQVRAGDKLVVLNTDLLNTQLEGTRAAAQVAAANLALLRAGSREQDIAAAQGQLEQAAALRDGARTALANAQATTVITQAQVLLHGAQLAYKDAQTNLRNPQDLQTQVIQARAARDSAQAAQTQAQTNAQASRDRLSAAKTQTESAVAQAANALRNAQDAYSKIYWDNRELEKLPGDLPQAYKDAEAAAKRAVDSGQQALDQARVAAENARQAELSGNQTAAEQLAAAQTGVTNAQASLDHILAVQASPQQLRAAADAAQTQLNSAQTGVTAATLQRQATIDSATAQLASAEAQVTQAQARLELAQAGTRAEQIAVAVAQQAQADAQVHQLEVQIAKATITAPVDGIVTEKVINLGEQAAPGNILIKLGSLAKVKLTIYVPEDEIGPLHVRQGASVRVQVDSFSDRAFTGAITFIAPQAEFTPRNVQTKNERATTVFAVRVELDNADGALKPGMPADATLEP